MLSTPVTMIVLIAETIERKNDLLFAELPRVTETVVVLPNPCQASLGTQVRTQHQPHHHHHHHRHHYIFTIVISSS